MIFFGKENSNRMHLYIKKFGKPVRSQKWLITILMILELQYFNLVEIKALDNYNTVSNKMLMMCIILLYVLFNYVLRRNYKLKHNSVSFINLAMFMVTLLIAVQALYTMPKYNETFVDIIRATGHLFMLALAYALIDIYLLEDSINGALNLISNITFVSMLLYLANAIVNNFTGISLLIVKVVQIRNGRPRITMPVMSTFMILYEWFEFLNDDRRNKRKHFVYVLIGLAGLFYVDMTRMLQISVIVSMVAIYFFRKNHTKNQLLFAIALIGILILIVNTDYFSGFLDSFSLTGSQGDSTRARLNAIAYFSEFTKDNLFLGMGMVRPYRQDLYNIYFGPIGTYNCLDDIGIFGLFFYYGLFGLILYIMLLLRWGWILIHVKNNCAYSLLVGLFVFALATSPSLIITNSQRSLLIPIFTSVFEFAYYQVRVNK